MNSTAEPNSAAQVVQVPVGGDILMGDLSVPAGAQAIVLFAHGSGSSRQSPRNRFVAQQLHSHGLATLLIDLLMSGEEMIDLQTLEPRFDVDLLAERLVGATDWLVRQPATQSLRIGYFGAGSGAGAVLTAVAERPDLVGAVVSRGGRPDLAARVLPRVRTPTLLIVGGNDFSVISLNRDTLMYLGGERSLEVVPGATHLFEEPGALEMVARLARDWFLRYLGAVRQDQALGE